MTSLQEYNQHIEALKEEMDEATESAEEIRKEIQSFRNKLVTNKWDGIILLQVSNTL